MSDLLKAYMSGSVAKSERRIRADAFTEATRAPDPALFSPSAPVVAGLPAHMRSEGFQKALSAVRDVADPTRSTVFDVATDASAMDALRKSIDEPMLDETSGNPGVPGFDATKNPNGAPDPMETIKKAMARQGIDFESPPPVSGPTTVRSELERIAKGCAMEKGDAGSGYADLPAPPKEKPEAAPIDATKTPDGDPKMATKPNDFVSKSVTAMDTLRGRYPDTARDVHVLEGNTRAAGLVNLAAQMSPMHRAGGTTDFTHAR